MSMANGFLPDLATWKRITWADCRCRSLTTEPGCAKQGPCACESTEIMTSKDQSRTASTVLDKDGGVGVLARTFTFSPSGSTDSKPIPRTTRANATRMDYGSAPAPGAPLQPTA
jgi:hypothetical protein